MGALRGSKLIKWLSDDNRSSGEEEEDGEELIHVVLLDLILSFMWVWAFALISLTPGSGWLAMAVKYIITWFLFAWMESLMGGGLVSPLPTLSSALSGSSHGLVACLLARIPAQVLGYLMGVKMLIRMFPEYEEGPSIDTISIFGVIIEGLGGFVFSIMHLLLKETGLGFFAKTCISSISTLSLTGFASPWMNPGFAFSWAYAKGIHLSMLHIMISWISQLVATLLGMEAYNSVVQPDRQRTRIKRKTIMWKSE